MKYEKSEKQRPEVSNRVKKIVKLFVFKYVLALEEVIFFCYYNEYIRKGNIIGKIRFLRIKKVFV